MLEVSNKGWSPQFSSVIYAAAIDIFNVVWKLMNNLRFKYQHYTQNTIISNFIVFISILGDFTTLARGPSMVDFLILEDFKVITHHPKTPKIIKVYWHPIISNWIKGNTNGSILGNLGSSTYLPLFFVYL